ncbi:MAG TPA: cytochrome c oxidase subunit 3 [Vicinamibacterales bacterium]|nr:cytochrome c oxidase subunit 3 [Vicinamibacterales bacterium]
MHIPYTVETRPDTGLHNARLGVWLFLASEVMLFAGLFSSYVLLRSGSAEWPRHTLPVAMAALNTALLITSSMTMVVAWAALKTRDWQRHRMYLALTVVLGAVFLLIKFAEYREHIAAGELPSHDTFFAIYYTLTGIHALHIAGGLVVMLYFLGPGSRLWAISPEQFANRIEATGLYWHFVDLVWILLFPVLYLL